MQPAPSRRRLTAALVAMPFVAALAGLIATAPPAAATVSTCVFDQASATVHIGVGDSATVSAAGGTISVSTIPCTNSGGTVTATVNNTDKIVATGDANDNFLSIQMEQGQFAPGKTNEPGTSDEIEWKIDLGSGSADFIDIFAGNASDHFTLGATGINFNADEGAPDLDATYANIDAGAVFGELGDDVIDATGCSFPLELHGSAGDDTVTGGAAADRIYGEDGNDTLDGGDSNDTLDDGDGNDAVNGGAGDDTFFLGTAPNGTDTYAGGSGTDFASYNGRTADLVVSLDGIANDGDPSANGGTGEGDNIGKDVESVFTGPGKDRITGSAGENLLIGGDGNDQISGRGGSDILQGGNGNDKFSAVDGVKDVVEGEAGTDSCTCDAIDQQIGIP